MTNITPLTLANEIAVILSCDNQERINASKEIIASLWNYTRQKEDGTTAFFIGMIMRIMQPEKQSQSLSMLANLTELAKERHEQLMELYRQEREAKRQELRARCHPAISASTMVYAGDDCGDL
jgi:hypothetical protein